MKDKIKVMKIKPEITDAEIQSYMNFDRLLEKHKAISNNNRYQRIAIIAVAVVMTAGGAWYFNMKTSSDQHEQNHGQETSNQQPEQSQTLVPDSANVLTQEEKSPVIAQQKAEKQTPSKKENLVKPEPAKTEPSKKETPKDVYVQAEPVDGYPQLYQYFRSELKYPEVAMKDSVQGEITVVMTISATGATENIRIENSLGPAFDKEAIRLIANMPKWKAATYNDKPVASTISLPLTFQIKRLKK